MHKFVLQGTMSLKKKGDSNTGLSPHYPGFTKALALLFSFPFLLSSPHGFGDHFGIYSSLCACVICVYDN